MIRLLLLDAQLNLSGLTALLDQEADMQVVGTADNRKEAIAQAEALRPDILLLEAQMPTVKEKIAVQSICEQLPDIKVLILSECADQMVEAIRAGVRGYLLKDMSAEALPMIIRLVHQGHTFLAPTLLEKLLPEILVSDRLKQAYPLLNELTSRQREVFDLIRTGITNYEIAQQLYIAEGTVKTHVTSLLNHFNLRNRAQLAACAHAVTQLQNRSSEHR